jgi:hypothetical protein
MPCGRWARRRRNAVGVPVRDLLADYPVVEITLSQVITRKAWRHL